MQDFQDKGGTVSRPSTDPSPYRPEAPRDVPPPTPGQQGVVLAALLIGILLMGIQLWLLTVALELYLGGGSEGDSWTLPLISGLIFLGGLVALWTLKKQQPPR